MRKSKAIPMRNSEQFAALCEAVLESGASVRFRAQGRSMQPNILNDDAVVVAPIEREELQRGDVALTHDADGFRVHRVAFADGTTGEIITRGDAGQECDAVVAQVFGKIISIERNGRVRSVDSATKRCVHAFRTLLHRTRRAVSLRFRKLAPISAVFSLAILIGILVNAAPAAGQALSITDTAAPTTVAPGGTITFTQVITNTSLLTAVTHPLTVTQNLPANTTFVSAGKTAGNDNWTCTLTSGVITCTDTSGGSYAAKDTTTFTIVVTVNAATANGTTITDTVNAKGANTATATANATVTVQTPDISVTNTDTPDPVDVASNISYTQTVTNNSTTVAAVGATLSETIPTNTTFQSITIPTGWTCGTVPAVGATGSISCSATSTLAASASSVFTVAVNVNSTVTSGTVISDTVTVAETGTETNTANNTATTTSTVQIPDVSVTNTDAPDPVAAGANITYTQKVTNNSATVPAVGATITQTTPTNTTFQSITPPTGWTCGTKPAVGGTGSIVCSATGTLAASTTVTFTLVVNVNSATASGTVISDSVTVTETGTDPNTTNSTATATSTVQVPDISVTETVTPNPVATGANITYTETVTNNGTAASVGTTLTQSTPPNTNFQSVTPPTGWTCGTHPAVGATGSIVCTVTASLAASTAVNFSVVVQVSPEAVVGSTITNSVSVSETGTEANLANNTATASTQVQGADLSMTQSASATAIAPGSTITYTETVSNTGPNAATGAVLYQQTPPNTTFVSMTPPTGWTCGTTPTAGGTGTVLCSASATMNANTTTGNFVFIVTVNSATAAGTSIVNTADVTSQTADPLASNNATNTSVLVEITGDSDLALSMTAAPSPVFISSNLTYTIQIQNLGLANSADGSLTDTIPTGTTFVSSATTQGSCSGTTTVTCTLGAITRGTTITVAITVSTPATPTTLTNTSSISTTTTDPVSANNSATLLTVVQPLVCAAPGRDGAGGTLTGIVNAYYPPATGALAAGSTSVVLGAAAAGGAQTPIAIGDLLLFIQAQDAAINSTNTGAYGDGFPGDPGSGFTNLNNSGNFEFVTATSAVTVTGGTLTFTGTGPTSGLLNTYTKAASTATQGQRTYQIVRVPQYTSATLSSGLTAMIWNGATGGVLAMDVASQLTLGGTVAVDALGFRGGAGRILGGGAGAASDYVTLATVATNASKGEGIAGTPRYIVNGAVASISQLPTDTGVEGLPNGSYSRGAPGNAGGGATDANPAANDQNSGGGGGGNGGAGGTGGFGWNSAGIVGGFGGAAFPVSTSALAMGGGAGAGTTNNGSYWIPSTDTGNNACGANCDGIYSSGAAGGGIVIIRAGSATGVGLITSNGGSALSVENDGGGGGGAGGTILVYTNAGGLGGLTVNALGGNGGITWPEQAPGTPFPANRHGPGAGGGGGVVLTSAASGGLAAANVAGGNPGVTTLADDAYGATVGQNGVVLSGLTITQTPGTQSGSFCAGADLAVTNAGTPNPVFAGPGPGNAITYTQTVTNNGPFDALNAVFSEAIPANTTFQSLSFPGGSGWTCTAPAVGSTGIITCTNPDFANAASTTFTVGVAVNTSVIIGTVITDVVNATAGNSDPNLTNNSATVQTTVGSSTTADLSVTNVASPNPVIAGNNITYAVVVKNNGGAAASTVSFSEPIPANTTFVSDTPPGGWTCAVASGTLTCSATTLASGASASFSVVLNVAAATPAGTVITDTVTVAATTTDSNPNNNVATATDVVATATQSDLSVTSSATPNPVTDGNNITYTQAVTNSGPAASGTATFTDTIPTGTTFVSFTPPAGWNCGASIPAVGGTGTISCTIASMPANSTVNFPLVVKASLGDTPGSTITNTANINIPCSSTTDPNCANNSASTNVTIASPTQSDLAITKTANPDPVNQGTNLQYTLQITNNGPAAAQNVTVTDPLPAQVTFVSVSTTQGTCPGPITTTVNCSLGTVSVGGLVLITINVNANTFSSSTLATNTASVGPTTNDPNLTNNSSSVTSTIAAPTAVQLASFRAVQRQGGGVLLEWKTREEIRNLGFNVFRLGGTGRQRLNPSIIAGSALLIRGGMPQHAAKTYQWFDPNGTPQSTYELEDVDLNGTRMPHGPVSVDVSLAPRSGAISQPLLLTQMNRMAAPILPIFGKRVLPTPVPTLPRAPQGTVPVSLDGDAAVKISVQTEGWYQVSKSQLVAAGFDPNSDARYLQLFAEGIEQPMLILGNQSGSLGPNDSIEFYGTGIDTPFSADRVYWLIRGARPGLRISSIAAANSGFSAQQSFPFTVILQERTTYFATLLNGENNDNFFGAAVTSEPVDQPLTVAHVDPNSSMQPTVDITLQGATDQQGHSVSVFFNGASIGEMDFANLSNVTQTFPVDRSLLQNGVNTVTLTALQGDNDVSTVQSIALHYPHTYDADANWLKATAPAGCSVRIAGFTSQQLHVFDITNPLAITQLTGTISQDNGSYGVTLGLPPASGQERTLLVFSDDQVSPPNTLAFHKPAALATQHPGSQMIIITHPDFQAAIAPLVALHESHGQSVQVVTIDEVFDAFNYGERSPFAIRAFLQSAASQTFRKPQYLLLVGDASLDPRNYLGLGDFDFVPTRIIETAAFKTATDDWFTDFNQNGYATIATGRLPVRTPADATLVVSKIVNYEKGLAPNSGNQQALMIADQNIGSDFTTATKFAATDLPTSLQAVELFADGMDPNVVQQQVVSALNAGPLLVNYSGHGSVEQWSFADFLDNTSASNLTNGNQLSVFLLMDCLNGFFHDVYSTSLAESLLLAPNGGAAAVWASSGFTNQPPQASMNQTLLQILKTSPSTTLGTAIVQAKNTITDNDVRRTWIFFGDPAMLLQIPPASSTARGPIRVAPPVILHPSFH